MLSPVHSEMSSCAAETSAGQGRPRSSAAKREHRKLAPWVVRPRPFWTLLASRRDDYRRRRPLSSGRPPVRLSRETPFAKGGVRLRQELAARLVRGVLPDPPWWVRCAAMGVVPHVGVIVVDPAERRVQRSPASSRRSTV